LKPITPAKPVLSLVGRTLTGLVLAGVLPTICTGLYGDEPKQRPATSRETPGFTDAEAVHILNELRQALESNQRSHLLKLVDARRMPMYAAFRDEVTEFFEKHDSFQVQYHLNQVRMDGEFGALLADFVLEAAAPDRTAPNLRRSVQMRLVTAWDGKQWKIVDLSPRSLFQ